MKMLRAIVTWICAVLFFLSALLLVFVIENSTLILVIVILYLIGRILIYAPSSGF